MLQGCREEEADSDRQAGPDAEKPGAPGRPVDGPKRRLVLAVLIVTAVAVTGIVGLVGGRMVGADRLAHGAILAPATGVPFERRSPKISEGRAGFRAHHRSPFDDRPAGLAGSDEQPGVRLGADRPDRVDLERLAVLHELGAAGSTRPADGVYTRPAMLTLVLTRHGLTDRSDPEQHLGQGIDIGLSVAGRAQAAALAGRIADQHFDRIVSSHLLRARETAATVALGRPVEPDPRLAEMDYGAWEGRTYEQIDAVDAAGRAAWAADPGALACPGGESGADVAARARSFLVDLLGWAARLPGEDPVVLAVAHSTLNRVLLCVAVGIPVREYRRRFTQSQANLTVLRWPTGSSPEKARILTVNDVSHVAPPGRAPWEPAPGA